MNDDTISRQGAIKAIEEMGFQKTSTVKAILCRLETLSSSQPEIVHCKDCKHRYDENKCPMVLEYYVDYDDDGYWESEWRTEDNTEDEGFCHKGEREEENEDE